MVDGNKDDRGQHGQQREHGDVQRKSNALCTPNAASTASAAVGWCAAGRPRRCTAPAVSAAVPATTRPSPSSPVSAASCRYSWCTKRASTGTPRWSR